MAGGGAPAGVRNRDRQRLIVEEVAWLCRRGDAGKQIGRRRAMRRECTAGALPAEPSVCQGVVITVKLQRLQRHDRRPSSHSSQIVSPLPVRRADAGPTNERAKFVRADSEALVHIDCFARNDLAHQCPRMMASRSGRQWTAVSSSGWQGTVGALAGESRRAVVIHRWTMCAGECKGCVWWRTTWEGRVHPNVWHEEALQLLYYESEYTVHATVAECGGRGPRVRGGGGGSMVYHKLENTSTFCPLLECTNAIIADEEESPPPPTRQTAGPGACR
jgi:hypothetical protein